MTKKIVKRTDANNEILYFYTHSDAVDVGEGNATTSLTNALNSKADASDLQSLSNTVNTKASASDLQALSNVVATKASTSDLNSLNNVVLKKTEQALTQAEKDQVHNNLDSDDFLDERAVRYDEYQVLGPEERELALVNLGLNGVDAEPTKNSQKMVRSGGVAGAIDNVQYARFDGIQETSVTLNTTTTATGNGSVLFYVPNNVFIYKVGSTYYTLWNNTNRLTNGFYNDDATTPHALTTKIFINTEDGLPYSFDGTNFTTVIIDDTPTAGSNNLVKSGGVQNELALGAVYDVSAKNPTAGSNNDGKFESLSALLSDANINILIPIAVRKGGMSIKFVQSSDNKYVQYRFLLSGSFTTAQFVSESSWVESFWSEDVWVIRNASVEFNLPSVFIKTLSVWNRATKSYSTLDINQTFTFSTSTNIAQFLRLKEDGTVEIATQNPSAQIINLLIYYRGEIHGGALYQNYIDYKNTFDNAIRILSQDVLPLNKMRLLPGAITSTAILVDYGEKILVLEVSGGNTIDVIRGSNGASQFAALAEFNYNNSEYSLVYATGESLRLQSTAGFVYSYTLPANAHYLVFRATSSSGDDILPSSIKIDGYDYTKSLKAHLLDVVERTEEAEDTLETLKPLTDILSQWKYYLKFESSKSSYATLITPILLENEGDILEIEFSTTSTGSNSAFAFSNKDGGNNYALSLSNNYIGLRDSTAQTNWLFNGVISPTLSSGKHIVKIEYSVDTVKCYMDGSLIKESSSTLGLKSVTIGQFGKGGTSPYYWDGIIYSIKVNGTELNLTSSFVLSNVGLISKETNTILTPNDYYLIGENLQIPELKNEVDDLIGKIKIHKSSANNFLIIVNSITGIPVKYEFAKYQKIWDSLSYIDSGGQTATATNVTSTDIWGNTSILKQDGIYIAQGMQGFIYRKNGSPYHSGNVHGLEVMKYFKVIADGVELDIASITDDVVCENVRIVIKSEIYEHNIEDSTNYYPGAVPKLDTNGVPVVETVRYVEYIFENGKATIDDSLAIQQNNFTFAQLNGAMLSCNYGTFDTVYVNTDENTINSVTSSGVFTPLSSSINIRNEAVLYANVVELYGNDFFIKKTLKSSLQDEVLVDPEFYDNQSPANVKFYFQAASVSGTPSGNVGRIFNEGDIVRVTSETVVQVK